MSRDLHSLWCNTPALDQAGAAGHPTGFLVEEEAFAGIRHIMSQYLDLVEHAVQAAELEAASRGLVGIVDFSSGWAVEAWQRRAASRSIGLRVEAATYPERLDDLIAMGAGTGDELAENLRVGPLKIIADGSMGSRTAHCIAPYPNPLPGYPNGKPNHTRSELLALLGRAVLGRHGAVLEAGSGALYVAGSDDSGAYGLSRFESLAASSPQWTGALNAGQLATNSRVLEREGRAEFCEFNRLGQEGLCTVSVSLSDGSPADWLPAGSRFLRIGEKKLVIDEGGSYTLLDGAGKKLWFRESGKVEWAHHVADSVILGGKDLVWRVDLDSGDPQWQETWGEGSELAEIDGKVIVVRTHEMLQTAVLDVTTGRPSFTSHGETPAPAAIMLTADGRLVVAGQGTGESGLYAAAIKPGTEQYLWQAWYSGYEEVMALSGHLVLRSQTGFAVLG